MYQGGPRRNKSNTRNGDYLLITNKGGAMKLPSLRNIERVVRMVPLVKDILPINNESDSGLLGIIKDQENALHDKKAEICKLRLKIKDLEQTLDITEELRTEAEVKLGKAGYREL